MASSNKRKATLVAAGHMLNDFYNDLLVPILPVVVKDMKISLTQAGAMVSTLSVTASLLQPFFGWLVDKKPRLWILSFSMIWITILMTLTGYAPSYGVFLGLVALAGLGSAVYHPLGSVMMTKAVGGGKGLAMSIYSAIGNFGEALVPLIVTPVALALGLKGLVVLVPPGIILAWLLYRESRKETAEEAGVALPPLTDEGQTRPAPVEAKTVTFPPETGRSWFWLVILDIVLILRSFVHVSLITFLPFYLAQRGYTTTGAGQILFVFMLTAALAIPFSGMLADKYGRKPVMIVSLVGTFLFLYAFLAAKGVMSIVLLALAGTLILASLPLAIVAAQELIPARAGMASGMIMGFAWGVGNLGATITGAMADTVGVASALHTVIWLLLPAALLAALLPASISKSVSAGEVSAAQ